MPSTYSTNLRLELIASGEQANTWGNTTNTNLGTLIESAISGYVSLNTMSDADYTLIALNGANDQARQMYLNVPSGVSLTATRAIIAPSVAKVYVISNNSSGGQAVRIKTSGSTTTCLIPNGQTKTVVCDGTNFSEAVTAAAVLTLGGDPTSALQATTKQYVDAADALKLNLTGGTMTGALNLIASTPTGNNATSFNYVNTNYIQKTGSGTQTVDQFLSLNYTPTLASHAIPKSYADDNFVGLNSVQTIAGTKTFSTNVSLSGSAQLILPNAPLSGTNATNKTYVDGIATAGQNYVDTYFALKSTRVIAGSGIQINGTSEGTLGSNLTISVVGGGTVTSVTATEPLVASGTTAVNLSIRLASSSQGGYLSNTDWTTFNSKCEANGSNATGTGWNISILGNAATSSSCTGNAATSSSCTGNAATSSSCTGNAATVTNGVYTSGTYSNPAWITSLAGSKISGAVSDSNSLGGTLASGYLTTSAAGTTYVAKSGSTMTGALSVQNVASSAKYINIDTVSQSGNYYPAIYSRNTSSTDYADLAIAQISTAATYKTAIFVGGGVEGIGTANTQGLVNINNHTTIYGNITANYNTSRGTGTTYGGNISAASLSAGGSVSAYASTGQLYISSDRNLKIDDPAQVEGLSIISALQPRYFYWKDEEGNIDTDKGRFLGFYAQEVEEVSHEAAPTGAGIYDRALIAHMTIAIQELNAKIEALTAEVNTLKGV